MQPGTPHFVYGLENSITHGGHFYSSSLMQATTTSLVHSFILSDFISNTFHHPSRQLLRRIVIFWGLALLENHFTPEGKSQLLFISNTKSFSFSDDEFFHLPDIQTVDGLLDLISGCCLAILGNVLDFRTYCAPNQREEDATTEEQQRLWKEFDRNNIPGDERMAICYARGVALAVFRWIRLWCIVKTPDGELVDDLPSKHIVDLLASLLAYKTKAVMQKLKGAPHCASWMLTAQVLNVVTCDSLIEDLWSKRNSRSSHSLRTTQNSGMPQRKNINKMA